MKKVYLLLTFTLLTTIAQATSLLAKEVTLSVKNQPLEDVLNAISEQTGLTFSYNASAVDVSQRVSVSVKNIAAELVLRLLLDDIYDYKLTRRYVILKKSQVRIEPEQTIDNKPVVRELEEYESITNQLYVKKFCYSDSGTLLGDCPIITNDKKNEVMKKHLAILTLAIATSSAAQAQTQDSLTVKEQLTNVGKSLSTLLAEVADGTSQAIKIAADEIGKQATSIKVASGRQDSGEKQDSSVAAVEITEAAAADENQRAQPATAPENTASSAAAVQSAPAAAPVQKDSVHPFLFTIIYPFSFPELNAQNHTYNFSLNLIAGYNGGVKGCELGYIANVNRHRMSGFQAAGVANVTMGTVDGIQVSGNVNFAGSSKDAVQLTGVTNVSLQGNSKAQLAGVANVAHTAEVQLAGVANAALQSKIQVAGVVNTALQSNVQLAWVANVSDKKSSVQISSVVNAADTAAFQLGLVNVAAHRVGTQIGLVNICDTSSGVMVGLVNVARRGGLRQLEVSAGMSSVNAALRLGTKKFYTFYEAAWDYENEVWRSGLGLGTQLDFQKNWGMNIEALHQNVVKKIFRANSYNGLTHVRVVGYKQLAKHLSLFAGPSLYVYSSDSKGDDAIDLKLPYTLYSNHSGRVFTDIWVGATVGVRF